MFSDKNNNIKLLDMIHKFYKNESTFFICFNINEIVVLRFKIDFSNPFVLYKE